MEMLSNRIEELYNIVKCNDDYLKYNAKLLAIYKGRLLEQVIEKMNEQFSGESLNFVIQRIPPINVWRRITDKQSKIYSGGVTREISGSVSVSDESILNYMLDVIQPNEVFQTLNAYFNMFKNGLINLYLKSDGTPGTRIIASDRFIPFSDDQIDPDNPTGFIVCMKKWNCPNDGNVNVYMAIDSGSFVYFTDKLRNVTNYFEPGSDGINYIGSTPFVYLNRDKENILPVQDSDSLAMSTLIPILLSDINYAHAFQAFSIMYGINVSDKGLKIAPNAFWVFEGPADGERKPEVGILQPTADINAGLNLVANQFALWLNSKGIKPGAVGEINGSNFASGVAKILDEMDTSEDRNEQIPYFVNAERQYWDLLLKKMLPFWQKTPNYKGIRGELFSATSYIKTTFSEQTPMIRRGQVIDDCKKEVDAGFTTRRRALKKLNPQMTEKEIEELEAEIELEKTENSNDGNTETGTGTGDTNAD